MFYQSSWNRCVIIVVVLTITCAYLTTEMDDLLLSKYVPFSKQSTEQVGASPFSAEKLKEYHTTIEDDNGDDDIDDDIVESESGSGNSDSGDDDGETAKATGTFPILEKTDMIYEIGRWGNPIIVPEYKLVFFTLPKVACTEWKLLFRRMYGLPEWPEDVKLIELHDPAKNDLMYISNYTMQEAQEMLTGEGWTRAVFVREPKERVLSAFLNKFVEEPTFYVQKCCQEKFFHLDAEREQCKSKKQEGDFVYFLNRTLDCSNPHWTPQVDAIDNKWWKQISFVGYMDHVADDAEKLLKQIRSSKGTSAWDDYGKSGWGSSGTNAFMVRDTAHHATNAHDKLRKYYTPCTERFVERNWETEWEQHMYSFTPFRLFNESEYPGDEDCEI